ncbi:MAG TPA: hypothetical protein VNU47_01560 [Candidatus Paceibacterota bacterium]|nr:hypothetical protein [Candidatus Paceibacterota bacterium]
MRRVHTIHAVRPFVSGAALAFVALGISLYTLGRLVFVAQVFRNMPALGDIGSLTRFFLDAFLTTEVVVQLITVAIVFSALWMVADLLKLMRLRARMA